MAEIVMPRLSDSMEEGTIIRWLKEQGEQVARGEELVEIETDKATMTYESDAAGALDIVAQEGATLPIGEVIARIGEGAVPAATARAASRRPRSPRRRRTSSRPTSGPCRACRRSRRRAPRRPRPTATARRSASARHRSRGGSRASSASS